MTDATRSRKPKINRAADQYVPQKYDACQTPAYALGPLLPYLKADWVIWEPANGEGLLASALRANGHPWVLPSDILTGQNFFTYQPEVYWSALVTNPPYTIKYKWLDHCYDLGKPFALLLPVETMGAKTAQRLFEKYGVEVIWLNKRVNFKMPDKGWSGAGAQFPVAWFTWGLGIGKENTFGHIELETQPRLL